MAGTFGNLPGNNAPVPVFGGNNPTGMMPGGFSSGESFGFPTIPMYGAPNTGMVSPTANMPLFSGTNMAHMSSGFNTDPANLNRQLDLAYGVGAGNTLTSIIAGGLFNPQVAESYINAMQPAYNRGVAGLETAFGAEGARFGSAAALGIGDYSSQFALNEQQVMAQMYMQAQQEQLQLLENVLPTLHAEQANKGGFWSDLIGGLEIAGGIAMEFVPGLQAPGAMLMGSGASTLAGGLSGNGGKVQAQTPTGAMPSLWGNNGIQTTTPPFLTPSQADPSLWDQYFTDMLKQQEASSAGAALGGANDTTNMMDIWNQG